MKNNQNRVLELDSLRGIAALAVVFYHYTYKFRDNFTHVFSDKFDLSYGHYGVQLFFIISGFVIFLTISKSRSGFDFLYKRFTRLFPTYWVCMTISFLVVNFIGRIPDIKSDYLEYFINLTMIQGIFRVKSIDGAYWSLLPELLFYFIMVVIFQMRLIKHIKYFGIFWLSLTVVKLFGWIPSQISTIMNLSFSSYFLSGILFYKIYTGDKAVLNNILILLSFLISCLLNSFTLEIVIVNTLIFGSFYLFVFDKLSFLKNRFLVFLGTISYALYLLHQYIGYVVLEYLINYCHLKGVYIIFIPMSVSITLAWLVTMYIERPAITKLRKLYNRF